jgi:hypothetical protein
MEQAAFSTWTRDGADYHLQTRSNTIPEEEYLYTCLRAIF